MKFTLVVTVPQDDFDVYLEDVVFPQIKEGYVSGHTDSETHWDSSKEEDEVEETGMEKWHCWICDFKAETMEVRNTHVKVRHPKNWATDTKEGRGE